MTARGKPPAGRGPWRSPTRRAFVAMLGAAAAAIAGRASLPVSAPAEDRPPSRWTGKPRWIGHC